MIFLGFSNPAWDANPHEVILKQQMDRTEAKLRQAEKAKGLERQKILETQMKMIEANNTLMRKEMDLLLKESMHMGPKITLKDLIDHARKDDRYHLVMNKMMDQMIRDEIVLLEIIKQK